MEHEAKVTFLWLSNWFSESYVIYNLYYFSAAKCPDFPIIHLLTKSTKAKYLKAKYSIFIIYMI
jgi:hypothetical protein